MPKKTARAFPRSATGKAATTIASAAGNMNAAPTPWMTRKAIIHGSATSASVGVAPHSADAPANTDHADHQHPAVTRDVGEAPPEGEEGGQGQQVRVDDPLRPGGRQAQVLLELRVSRARRSSGR